MPNPTVILPFTALLYDERVLSNSNFKRGGQIFASQKKPKTRIPCCEIWFFCLAASFDFKNLVKSQQRLLAANLKIPQLPSMTFTCDRRKYFQILLKKSTGKLLCSQVRFGSELCVRGTKLFGPTAQNRISRRRLYRRQKTAISTPGNGPKPGKKFWLVSTSKPACLIRMKLMKVREKCLASCWIKNSKVHNFWGIFTCTQASHKSFYSGFIFQHFYKNSIC